MSDLLIFVVLLPVYYVFGCGVFAFFASGYDKDEWIKLMKYWVFNKREA